jgi:hypothetical protein
MSSSANLHELNIKNGCDCSGGVPEFLLRGNPLLCDCQLEWLQSLGQLAARGGHPRVLDLDALLCTLNGGPPSANLTASSMVPLLQVRQEQFMCAYEAHCIPQCFCCDFFACDCRMQCPEGCSCYHDNTWTNNIIQCSARGHSDVPPLIPMDATTIYLDGNNMTELVNPGFIGRRRVHAVYLNNSMVRTVTNYSFEGLTELRVLHLEDNQIEQLAGNEFTGLEQLKELYLQNNYITAIAVETFRGLSSLAVLRLDSNLLSVFPVWELAAVHNPLLVGLYLGANMWSCDCDYLRPFRAFKAALGSKLVDGTQLRCVADHFRGEALTHLDNVGCGSEDGADGGLIGQDFQSSASSSSGGSSSLDYTPILVSVLLAVLIIVVGYLVAFTFRKSIRGWLCKGKMAANGGQKAANIANGSHSDYSNGKEKLFDVFISYALEDRDFVEQTFASNLEHGATAYRLCLHQRDFPPTTPVYDTVAVAVESSARALIVLSRSYLDHQWEQIRLPFLESITANNTKLVFVQLDEEEGGVMTAGSSCAQLRHLVEGSPLIQWGDPGFWNKLRHFLPEPVYLTFHRNVTMRGTLQSNSNLYQPVLGNGRPTVGGGGRLLLPLCTAGGGGGEEGCESSKCEQPYLAGGGCPSTTYAGSEHTYHSIDNGHIYHTLDPGSTPSHFLQFQHTQQQHQQQLAALSGPVPGRVYINNSLDLVAKLPQLGSQQQQQHYHHQQQLLQPASITLSRTAAPQQRPAALNASLLSSGSNNNNNSVLQHHHHRSNQQQQQQFGQPAICHSGPVAPQPAVHHAHTNSTSSAKRLLSGEDGEYIV